MTKGNQIISVNFVKMIKSLYLHRTSQSKVTDFFQNPVESLLITESNMENWRVWGLCFEKDNMYSRLFLLIKFSYVYLTV